MKKKNLETFATKPFVTYLNKMSKDGTYGDNIAVQNVSKMLNIQINIIDELQDIVIGDGPTQVHIGYLPDILHYVSLRLLTGYDGRIEVEKYYPVFYTHPMNFYIGHVTNVACMCDSQPMLHVKQLQLAKDSAKF